MRTQAITSLLLGAMLSTPLLAAESGFDMPSFDATAGMDNSKPDSQAWRHTLSYDAGWDSKTGQQIINRLGWRLQWEGLLGKDYYVVVDAKLRAFAEGDIQNRLSQGIDVQAKLNSLYLQKSLAKSSWQIGYQVVNLGFMDILAINDVLSPWDYSEAAFTSPEDARLGQPIIAWSWFGQQRQWDVYLNLAPDRNRYSVNTETRLAKLFGFSNFIDAGPSQAADQMELVMRSRSHRGKQDQQWLLGSLLQNDPNIIAVNVSTATTEYPRYNLLGYGYSYTSGNQQWKFEAAYKQGLKPIDALGTKLDQVDSAIGWEYNANGAYTLAIEAGRTDRMLPAGTSPLIEKQLTQVVGRWSKSFLHDTVTLTAYAGKVNPGPITTASAGLSYTPRDDWYIELLTTQIDSKNSAFDILPSSTSVKFSYHM